MLPWGFAHASDQSSPDSGVLVVGSNGKSQLKQTLDQGYQNTDGNVSSLNNTGNNNDNVKRVGSSTDEIIVKATDAVMFEITANMKLTQDQMNAIRPIITDNIIKVRNLQMSLEKGDIDGKTMYSQKQQAITDENERLTSILSSDQMKVWIKIQDQ